MPVPKKKEKENKQGPQEKASSLIEDCVRVHAAQKRLHCFQPSESSSQGESSLKRFSCLITVKLFYSFNPLHSFCSMSPQLLRCVSFARSGNQNKSATHVEADTQKCYPHGYTCKNSINQQWVVVTLLHQSFSLNNKWVNIYCFPVSLLPFLSRYAAKKRARLNS